MKPSLRIVIVLEGGLVQAVVTDDPALVGASVAIVDYDIEDSQGDITLVGQADGTDSEACARLEEVGCATIDTAGLWKRLGIRHKAIEATPLEDRSPDRWEGERCEAERGR